MIHVTRDTILPDGTPAKKKGSLYIIKNTIINVKKVRAIYPDWIVKPGDIKLVARAAKKVFV